MELAKLSPIPFKNYDLPESGFKSASVLALIYLKDEEWTLLFIERSSKYPGDKHAGQISFPGGQKEGVESDWECALRETFEEVGIPTDSISLISPLSKLYIPVSNFLVTPYLAYLENPPSFIIQESEVKQTIEISISHLLDPTHFKRGDVTGGGRIIKDVPYFDLDGKILWGATSMMTAEILAYIKKAVEIKGENES